MLFAAESKKTSFYFHTLTCIWCSCIAVVATTNFAFSDRNFSHFWSQKFTA